MVVKSKIKKKKNKHSLEPSSFLGDHFSRNSHTIQSEKTSAWNKRINEDTGNNFGSKQGLEEIDVHSTEGPDYHEPSVFDGSTMKSEGSWIQRAAAIDIQSHIDSAPESLENDAPKTIPGEILVNESRDSNPSPRSEGSD